MHLTHVVVDGSNIATEGRDLPSLHQLDEAVRAFMAEHEVDNITVIVDATFGHRIDASERDEYEEAILAQELTTPPAGAIGRGDAFVLSIADRATATILSNDSFQEFHGQYPWLFDEGRIIGGKPVPGVGWVFVPRSPVRGPISRKAVRDARSGKAGVAGGNANRRRRRGRGERSDEPAVPERPTETAKAAPAMQAEGGSRNRRKGRTKAKPAEPVNDFLPYVEFVGAHPVGSTVEGTVDVFSSHGAYVHVGEVACYLPLKQMAEPAPRSAREVLAVGETRAFVVLELDPPRRSVDLTLLPLGGASPRTDDAERDVARSGGARPSGERAARGSSRRAPRDDAANRDGRAVSRQDGRTRRGSERTDEVDVRVVAGDAGGDVDTAVAAKPNTAARVVATTSSTEQHAQEAPVTPVKKSTAKKAAKKAPAKKAAKKAVKKTVKRAPAKKAAKKTVKKAAKKAPAKKAAKKATKKATKKAPARKAAKKATKKATKKAPARKAAAKKATKRAPARKAARKAPARKR